MWWLRWYTRKYFRSSMKPISHEHAYRIVKRLRYLYLFIGWNAFMVSYWYYKKYKNDRLDKGFIEDVSDFHRHLRLSGTDKHTIYRIGFGQPIQKYEYNRDEYIKHQAEKEKITRHAYLEKREKEIREAQQLPEEVFHYNVNDTEDKELLRN